MITVSVVGILAAIAVPQYNLFILRAKRAELPVNLDAIRIAELSYHAEWDIFTTCALQPPAPPGRKQVWFPANNFTNFDWNQLGWVPDGKVFGQYSVAATASFSDEAEFTANAYSDIDGDGNLAHFEGTRQVKPWLMTPTIVY